MPRICLNEAVSGQPTSVTNHMHFNFHARTFPSREEATAVFYGINAQMQQHIPNAFLTMSEVDTGDFAVLLGCHDDDVDFVATVDPIWAHAPAIEIGMEAWMALEANHSRHITEYAKKHPGEDMIMLDSEVDIMSDGTQRKG